MSSRSIDTSSRNQQVLHVIQITLVLNCFIAITKTVVGLATGSMTVLADGFHGFVDAANNVLGIFTMRLATRPADEDHPYGHQKFENVAAMVIGALIFGLGWEVIKQVFHTVWEIYRGHRDVAASRAPLEWHYVAVVAMTLAANFFISTYERRQGERLNSAFLKADAAHTRSDIIVTSMSILSLVVSSHLWWLDTLFALIVVGFIFWAGWLILRENFDVFTDRVRLDPNEVRKVVEGVPGVLNSHAIRSHGTETDIHLDLHIVVGEHLSAKETEEIEETVRRVLQERYPNISFVSIHHQTAPHESNGPVWCD